MAADKTLYHYTNASGLCGILSGKLWTSSFRYMNDAKELENAFDLISELYPPEKTGLAPLPDSSFAAHVQKTKWHRRDFDFLFLICFSEDGDQLNQWRAYARPHSGYSIGFSRKFLKSMHESAVLTRCIYSKDYQRKAVKKILDKHIPTLRSKYAKHGLAREYLDQVEKTTNDMLPLATKLKYHKFSDEQEWRVVIDTNEKIKYRSSGNTVIPYLELTIDPKKQPIREIKVGPGPHKGRSEGSLNQMVSTFGFKDVRITVSDVPLINW